MRRTWPRRSSPGPRLTAMPDTLPILMTLPKRCFIIGRIALWCRGRPRACSGPSLRPVCNDIRRSSVTVEGRRLFTRTSRPRVSLTVARSAGSQSSACGVGLDDDRLAASCDDLVAQRRAWSPPGCSDRDRRAVDCHCSLMLRPIPREPPVTSATLPLRSNTDASLRGLGFVERYRFQVRVAALSCP